MGRKVRSDPLIERGLMEQPMVLTDGANAIRLYTVGRLNLKEE